MANFKKLAIWFGLILVFSLLFPTTGDQVKAQSPGPGFLNIVEPVSGIVVTEPEFSITGTGGGGHQVVNDCPNTSPKTFIWERGELQTPAEFWITLEGSSIILLSGDFNLNQLAGQHPPQECGNGSLGQNFTYNFDFTANVSTLPPGQYEFTARTLNLDFGNYVSDSFLFEIGALPMPKVETSINVASLTWALRNPGSYSFLVTNNGQSGSVMDYVSRVPVPWINIVQGATGVGLGQGDSRLVTFQIDLSEARSEDLEFGVNQWAIDFQCINETGLPEDCLFPNPVSVDVIYTIPEPVVNLSGRVVD